ncbi:hypothetical protein [Halorubrum sp. FL23]|uniref:hypothetical protein n=1 Tax=Halorubrum sp. FL23 TaxID=3458704 RepID=UPI004033E1B9
MQDTVRSRTTETIVDACDRENPVLVEAPPASGKTYNSVRLAAEDGKKILYLTARQDLYTQAIEEAEKVSGINAMVIPSPYRDCPTFADENDGETEKARKLYQKGLSGEEIHYKPWNTVNTPCQGRSSTCPYLTKRDKIKKNADEIDLLIGNHQHAHVPRYLQGRTVVFDEFNIDPFLTRFPQRTKSGERRNIPHEIIGSFLQAVDDIPLSDLTDLIEARVERSDSWKTTIEWFKQNGATKSTSIEQVAITPHPYNNSHQFAALLSCALLVMEKVGAGIELAHDAEIWEACGVDSHVRCVRDRNSGEMLVLTPPDLSHADQVIALDALPVKRLWEAVLGCDFTLSRVIGREELDQYLTEGLGFNIIQLAEGMNHYSSGKTSSRDRERMLTVRSLEGQRFPIISRKRALDSYASESWLKQCVIQVDNEETETDLEGYFARNYAKVLSSNLFKNESVGFVSGSPFPGDDVVKQWAALCGEVTEPERDGTGNSGSLNGFSGFGEEVYRHLTHNQVFQAILRFGRTEGAREQSTSVYVNTQAIPDWISTSQITIYDSNSSGKLIHVLEELLRARYDGGISWQTQRTLRDRINKNPERGGVSDETVRKVVSDESFSDAVEAREDAGKGGADLYRWSDQCVLSPYYDRGKRANHMFRTGSRVYLIHVPEIIDLPNSASHVESV